MEQKYTEQKCMDQKCIEQRQKRQQIHVNGKNYTIIRVLGNRGPDYLYQVTCRGVIYVLKQYRQVNNVLPYGKITRDAENYRILSELRLPVPKIIEMDSDAGIMVKEYIPGTPVTDMIFQGEVKWEYLQQVKDMADIIESEGYVLDYLPGNFIVKKDRLFYINYRLNPKSGDNDFGQRGIRYWMNATGFIM